MASPSFAAPTVIAVEMHDGKPTPDLLPLLPEAMTVAIPLDRSVSMAGLRASASQLVAVTPPLRLMLAAAIGRVSASTATRSSPLSWSLV